MTLRIKLKGNQLLTFASVDAPMKSGQRVALNDDISKELC